MRHAREFQADSGQQRLKDGNADDALRHRAYRLPGQRNKILASLRHKTRLNPPDGRNEARAIEEQKAGQHHRQQEFECSDAGAAGKGEYRAGQWLQVRR